MVTTLKKFDRLETPAWHARFIRRNTVPTRAKKQNCSQLYNRARYYDTSTGEFCSRDPLEYVDGMSMMRGYMEIARIDPMGTHLNEIGETDDGSRVFTEQHSGDCVVCDNVNGEILDGYPHSGKFRPCNCDDVFDKESFEFRDGHIFRDPFSKGRSVRKNALFDFKVLGNHASSCCFVQFKKGKMIDASTGKVLKIKNCDTEGVDMDWPEWTVDSVDGNPLWGSNPTNKDGTFTLGDRPNLPIGTQRIDFKFKMCAFNCDDVPDSCEGANFANAIKCVDWEFSGRFTLEGALIIDGRVVSYSGLPTR